jgi:hypothetical protein
MIQFTRRYFKNTFRASPCQVNVVLLLSFIALVHVGQVSVIVVCFRLKAQNFNKLNTIKRLIKKLIERKVMSLLTLSGNDNVIMISKISAVI